MNMYLQHSFFPLVILYLLLNLVILYVYKEKQDQAVCAAHFAKNINKMYLNVLSLRNRQCAHWYQSKLCRNNPECQDSGLLFLFVYLIVLEGKSHPLCVCC